MKNSISDFHTENLYVNFIGFNVQDFISFIKLKEFLKSKSFEIFTLNQKTVIYQKVQRRLLNEPKIALACISYQVTKVKSKIGIFRV
jgi:hypothetical protein